MSNKCCEIMSTKAKKLQTIQEVMELLEKEIQMWNSSNKTNNEKILATIVIARIVNQIKGNKLPKIS